LAAERPRYGYQRLWVLLRREGWEVKERAAPGAEGLDALTPAERRVLRLISQYKTTKEIAEALFISPRTVESHRASITQKLGLRGSHSLMRYALQHLAELERE
jgi:DNA-binding CsgD family transcriptional regulator